MISGVSQRRCVRPAPALDTYIRQHRRLHSSLVFFMALMPISSCYAWCNSARFLASPTPGCMTTAVANLRHRAISMQDARTGAAYQFAHQNGGSVGFFASTTEPVFLRLVRTDKRWFELQTAVVSYTMPPDAQGEESVVDIVAMVHLADPLYYKELQEATQDHDRVLYELIVDKDVVSEDSAGVRRLSEPMMPSFDQLRLAARHGLQAQLEGMDYMKDSWVLADMDRTAIRLLQRQRGEGAAPSALEAAMAGWGPGNLQLVPADIVRRWLRAPLWMVPCPEGAMLTLDWALSSRGLVSEVLTAIFDCALTFDFRAVSKLSFAQLLVSGAMVCDGPQTVLIGERNSVALREISRAQTHGCKRTALLYGGLHGPDLDKRMQRDLGMTRKGQKWITAWRIAVPTPCTTVSNLAGALSLYLSLDALDWILTIQGIADSTAHSGCWDRAVALAFAYVLRHALLYYSIGRWVISWERPRT